MPPAARPAQALAPPPLTQVQSSCVKDFDGTVYCPTSFPNPINYGFMWNTTAFYVLGRVIANETRALWLAGAVEASDWSGRGHIGLDVWSRECAPPAARASGTWRGAHRCCPPQLTPPPPLATSHPRSQH